MIKMPEINKTFFAAPFMKLANRGGAWNRRIIFVDEEKIGYYSKVPKDYVTNTHPEKVDPKQV